MTNSIEQKLIAAGCKVWTGGENKRIYINEQHLEAVFGLVGTNYKGENLSKNKAQKLRMILTSAYFNCITGKWVGLQHSKFDLTPII